MTIGHDLEHRLDSWMQEDATLPDDLGEVIAKLPQTPQRRHRWSLPFADMTWRIRTMFNATRVAAAVAIFALGATSAFALVPRGELTDEAIVPAAEEPSVEDMARFTWRAFTSGEDPSSATATRTEFGEAVRGGVVKFDVEATDPRVTGTVTNTYNLNFIDSDAIMYPSGIIVAASVLVNEGGTWEGSYVGLDYPGTPDSHGQSVLVGTGDYEGLTVIVTGDGSHHQGLIFPGGMPELP